MLLKHLLPAIHCVSGDFFTFQQDRAPAHRGASESVALLSAETPDFFSQLEYISPLEWLPNSPDLNPMNYVT